ncbi:uncharacterized protein LOC124145989 [Haliotis rufescens]|uniref:uncharacterized protein LOC124145989 n=1 Tax=Haliotis rufescens TaxID=6454 RepID=UPI00201F9C83|nr:uncharacterized protein LOC124145989 [Haliotis rufescens]
MAGTRISILGQCTDTDKFTIAFEDLTTDRKVLAMDVDMSTRTARRYHEVADMAADDTWSTFPFTAGQTFNITLSVLVDNIRILVGDQEMTLCEYKTQALRLASHVTIHGGITVEQVDLIYP